MDPSPGRDQLVRSMQRHADEVILSEVSYAMRHSGMVAEEYEKVTQLRRILTIWRDETKVRLCRQKAYIRRTFSRWRRAMASKGHQRYLQALQNRQNNPRWSEPSQNPSPRKKQMIRNAHSWRHDPENLRHHAASEEVRLGIAGEEARRGGQHENGSGEMTSPQTMLAMGLVSPPTPFSARVSGSARMPNRVTGMREREGSSTLEGLPQHSSLLSMECDERGSPSPRTARPCPVPYLEGREGSEGWTYAGRSDGGRRASVSTAEVGNTYYPFVEDEDDEGEGTQRGLDVSSTSMPPITESMKKSYGIAACNAFVSVMEAKLKHSALLRWKARAAHSRRRLTIQQA